MPRFAVLRHDSPQRLHWDFLLEMGNTLKTWALPQAPESGAEMTCKALPDHRLAYLEYEGPVSGQRGSVTRWDQGTYRILRQSDSELAVELAGQKLAGQVILERSPQGADRWTFSLAAE
jgi:hypothetical protein